MLQHKFHRNIGDPRFGHSLPAFSLALRAKAPCTRSVHTSITNILQEQYAGGPGWVRSCLDRKVHPRAVCAYSGHFSDTTIEDKSTPVFSLCHHFACCGRVYLSPGSTLPNVTLAYEKAPTTTVWWMPQIDKEVRSPGRTANLPGSFYFSLANYGSGAANHLDKACTGRNEKKKKI